MNETAWSAVQRLFHQRGSSQIVGFSGLFECWMSDLSGSALPKDTKEWTEKNAWHLSAWLNPTPSPITALIWDMSDSSGE